MTRPRRRAPDQWLRRMRLEVAAAYYGLTERMFKNEVRAGRIPEPSQPTPGVDIWYWEDFDAAMDRQKGVVAPADDPKGELDEWRP